jgi:hypothetical protein
MNIYRTFQQNKRLHQLLGELGTSAEDKASMVCSFTEGRTEKSSEMYQGECNNLIHYLQGQLEQKQLSGEILTKEEMAVRCNTMRRKILSCCHQMGWYVRIDGRLHLKAGRPVLDFPRINKFCTEKGPSKKAFNDHSYNELVTLVSVFDKILQSEMNKV